MEASTADLDGSEISADDGDDKEKREQRRLARMEKVPAPPSPRPARSLSPQVAGHRITSDSSDRSETLDERPASTSHRLVKSWRAAHAGVGVAEPRRDARRGPGSPPPPPPPPPPARRSRTRRDHPGPAVLVSPGPSKPQRRPQTLPLPRRPTALHTFRRLVSGNGRPEQQKRSFSAPKQKKRGVRPALLAYPRPAAAPPPRD